MLEYVYVKLTTGEDLISYKVGETPTSIFLSKPIVIRQSLSLSGEMKPTAQAFCGLAKNNSVEVYKTSCIFSSEMREEAKAYYTSLADQHYGAIEESIINEDYKKPLRTKTTKVTLEDSVETSSDTIKTKLH